MWTDENGVEYNEQELRVMLYNLGMLHPAAVMACRDTIEYRGYTFREKAEVPLYADKAA